MIDFAIQQSYALKIQQNKKSAQVKLVFKEDNTNQDLLRPSCKATL